MALALGNALVGNPPDAAALEICLVGPTLRANEELGCVVYGAPFTFTGDRHARPGALRAGKTFTLLAGETLRIGGTPEGARAYFCVHGGLRGRTVLGSQSALQPLHAGDALGCQSSTIAARYLGSLEDVFTLNDAIRVLPCGRSNHWRLSEDCACH
jgi:allophanate hydrolase subunit 2